MHAIVEIGGKQFKVEKEQKLRVPLIHEKSGAKIKFDRVLFFIDDKGKEEIGAPTVKNMQVTATVLEHDREKKIVVFKKKRRKGYQVKNGHRQHFSLISIDEIGQAKAEKKKTEEKKADTKTTAKTENEKETRAKEPAKKTVKKTTKKTEEKKES